MKLLYQQQNFKDLEAFYVKRKQLFTDPLFPPSESSLYQDSKVGFTKFKGKIEWRRIQELIPTNLENKDFNLLALNPTKQGCLGDCWLIGAMNALPQNMIFNVLPQLAKIYYGSQEAAHQNLPIPPISYPSLFEVRLFIDGKLVSVVIDDYLPVDAEDGHLIFGSYYSPKSTNDPLDWTFLWGALIEKAIAKVFGNYQALEHGHASEGLSLLSGYMVEDVSITNFTQAVNSFKKRKIPGHGLKFTDSAFFQFIECDSQEALAAMALTSSTPLNGTNGKRKNKTSLGKRIKQALFGERLLKKSSAANASGKMDVSPSNMLEASRIFGSFLVKSYEHGSLMTASLTNPESEKVGLLIGHTFTVCKVLALNGETWIKLQNPWGKCNYVSKYDKIKQKELNAYLLSRNQAIISNANANNGRGGNSNLKSTELVLNTAFAKQREGCEFWMTVESFCMHFATLICAHRTRPINENNSLEMTVFREARSSPSAGSPGLDPLLDLSKSDVILAASDCSWNERTSGGCLNFPGTFLNNPSYKLHIERESVVTICINQSVYESYKRMLTSKTAHGKYGTEKIYGPSSNNAANENTLNSIGFTLFRVEGNRAVGLNKALDSDFWTDKGIVESSGDKRTSKLQQSDLSVNISGMVTFLNATQVLARFKLAPGRYVIVPSTFQPGVVQNFALRVHINYFKGGSTSKSNSKPVLETGHNPNARHQNAKLGFTHSISRKADKNRKKSMRFAQEDFDIFRILSGKGDRSSGSVVQSLKTLPHLDWQSENMTYVKFSVGQVKWSKEFLMRYQSLPQKQLALKLTLKSMEGSSSKAIQEHLMLLPEPSNNNQVLEVGELFSYFLDVPHPNRVKELSNRTLEFELVTCSSSDSVISASSVGHVLGCGVLPALSWNYGRTEPGPSRLTVPVISAVGVNVAVLTLQSRFLTKPSSSSSKNADIKLPSPIKIKENEL